MLVQFVITFSRYGSHWFHCFHFLDHRLPYGHAKLYPGPIIQEKEKVSGFTENAVNGGSDMVDFP